MKFTEIINNPKPILIDFYAEWCAPCKMVPPILKQVKSTLGERVQIIKIDVDKNPELAKKYNIRSVPTLMIFRNGKVEWSQAGVAQANDLIKALQFLN